jgi:hypothetical protein
MRNWISKELQATVSVLELLGVQLLKDLCLGIARTSRFLTHLVESMTTFNEGKGVE